MAVSVIEVASNTSILTGTTVTVSLTETPAAGDVIVVAHMAIGPVTVSSVSGCGATWTVAYQPAIATNTSRGSVAFAVGTGANASGTITLTRDDNRAGTMRAYLVRGLSDATVVGVDDNVTTNVSTLAGTRQTVGDGQFVVAAFEDSEFSGSTVPTWPATGTDPSVAAWSSIGPLFTSSRWTGVESHVPTTSGNAGTNASLPTARNIRISQITVGTAGGGSTPVSLTGVTADVAVAAPAGTVAAGSGSTPVALTGVTANVTVAAPAGSVTAGSGSTPVSLTGVTANVTVAAPAGSVSTSAAVTPISLEFLIGSRLEITGAADVTPISLEFLLSTALRLNLPREWAADPRTNRPQYQWVITHRDGTRYGELDAVTADDIEEGVNERGETSFTIATDDPKHDLIAPYVRECQVWRGGDLLHRGPIMVGRESDDGTTTTYTVPDFRWYYEGRGSADGANRLMARVPRLQLLKNGGFTQGFTYWRALYDAESIPALPPLYTIVDDPETLSGKAIDVTGADESQLHTEDVATSAVFVPNESTYLSGGEAIIEAVGDNIPDGATVRITGHTANDGTGSGLGLSHDRALAAKATLAAQNGTLEFVTPDTSKWKPGQYVTGGNVAGRGYYEPVSKELAPNRRVTIAYDGTLPATGHKQFIVQTYYIAHPTTAKYPLTLTANARYKLLEYIGASADGWNLRVRAVRTSTLEEYDAASASISEDTPLNRWFDLEASVEIPADGNSYRIDVRLYPPAGTARFADVGLYPEELLYFWGVDQAHIVRDVLAFAQDPDYGWSDLGITTRTPVTGVTRDRSYELTGGSPLPVKQVLDEFPSLAHGVDIGVTMRHDLARVDTHYPRQGGPTNVVLVEGGAVVRARPASDRDSFSLVLVRASEGGRYRPEALAKDDAALDGLRLAKYLTAESETPITELDEAARDELARSKVTTPAYIVECDPSYTSELRSRLGLGDTCRLILPRYGFDGLVRMMQRAQDPNTDGLTLLLTVED